MYWAWVFGVDGAPMTEVLGDEIDGMDNFD